MSPSSASDAVLFPPEKAAVPWKESLAAATATRVPPAVTSSSERKKSPFGPSYQAKPGP